jgi:hypothetical protein
MYLDIGGDNWQSVIDRPIVERMVSLVANAPIFYSLDFGIDDKGRTLLIEINDGYALGNYRYTVLNNMQK